MDGDIVHIPSPASRAVHLMVGDEPVQTAEIGEKGTLSELLVAAKVPTGVFAIGRATISRVDAEGKSRDVAEIDLAELMLDYNAELDADLRPGDIIRIPDSASKFVYLLVERPGVTERGGHRAARVERPARGDGLEAVRQGTATPPAPTGRPGVQKIRHPLGEVRALSRVLLDADVEPALFETSVAVVSRIEKSPPEKDGGSDPIEIRTSAAIDLYELILNLDKSSDVDLAPNDLVYIMPRRKALDRGHVYALGAVQKPGPYKCTARLDARELIKEAGGYLPETLDPDFIIVRGSDADGDGEPLGAHSITNTRPHAPEFLVRTGDTVYVRPPKAAKRDGQIQVLGSVERPGKIPYEAEMTIGDALKKAGGCNGLGSLGKIVVKRPRDGGVKAVVRLLRDTLEKRYGGRGPKLEPGDIVVVHP